MPFEAETSSSYSAEEFQDAQEDADKEEENHADVNYRMNHGPKLPSAEQQDQHCATGHALFRSWCAACVQGRGRCKPHTQSGTDEDQVPVLS